MSMESLERGLKGLIGGIANSWKVDHVHKALSKAFELGYAAGKRDGREIQRQIFRRAVASILDPKPKRTK